MLETGYSTGIVLRISVSTVMCRILETETLSSSFKGYWTLGGLRGGAPQTTVAHLILNRSIVHPSPHNTEPQIPMTQNPTAPKCQDP